MSWFWLLCVCDWKPGVFIDPAWKWEFWLLPTTTTYTCGAQLLPSQSECSRLMTQFTLFWQLCRDWVRLCEIPRFCGSAISCLLSTCYPLPPTRVVGKWCLTLSSWEYSWFEVHHYPPWVYTLGVCECEWVMCVSELLVSVDFVELRISPWFEKSITIHLTHAHTYTPLVVVVGDVSVNWCVGEWVVGKCRLCRVENILDLKSTIHVTTTHLHTICVVSKWELCCDGGVVVGKCWLCWVENILDLKSAIHLHPSCAKREWVNWSGLR